MTNEIKCKGMECVYSYLAANGQRRYLVKYKQKRGGKWMVYRKRGFQSITDAQSYRKKLAKLKYDGRFFPENIDLDFYKQNGVGKRLPRNSKVVFEAWDNVEIARTGVYFIQPAGGGLIKVGYTDDIYKRFRQLQYQSPIPLKVLGVIPGNKMLEVGLHLSFIKERHHGEWFLPQGKVKDFLSDHGLKFIDPVFSYTKDWDQSILVKLQEHFGQKSNDSIVDIEPKESELVLGQS